MALIDFVTEGHLARVSLNRPEKLNAINIEMLEILGELADKICDDGNIRCVIIVSNCEKAFSVGADIKQWGALSPLEMGGKWVRRGHEIFGKWAALPQPTIAVVNSLAFGGGFEFAMSNDIRIAEPNAKFAMPEAKIGTCPGWLGSRRLFEFAAPGIIKYMLFTGESLTADEALSRGLVEFVTEEKFGLAKAEKIAGMILKNSPVSVRLNKQMVNAFQSGNSGYALEAMAGSLAAFSHDGKEGLEAFLEKRPPEFKGN